MQHDAHVQVHNAVRRCVHGFIAEAQAAERSTVRNSAYGKMAGYQEAVNKLLRAGDYGTAAEREACWAHAERLSAKAQAISDRLQAANIAYGDDA